MHQGWGFFCVYWKNQDIYLSLGTHPLACIQRSLRLRLSLSHDSPVCPSFDLICPVHEHMHADMHACMRMHAWTHRNTRDLTLPCRDMDEWASENTHPHTHTQNNEREREGYTDVTVWALKTLWRGCLSVMPPWPRARACECHPDRVCGLS